MSVLRPDAKRGKNREMSVLRPDAKRGKNRHRFEQWERGAAEMRY